MTLHNLYEMQHREDFYKKRYNYLRHLVAELQCNPDTDDATYNRALQELEDTRNKMEACSCY